MQKNCNWTFTFQYKCKIIASPYFQKYTKISQHLAKQLWFVTKSLQLKLKISNNFQKYCILNWQNFCDLAQNFLIIKEDSWSYTTILKVPIIQLIVPVTFWHDCCFCVVSFQMLQSFFRFPGFFHANVNNKIARLESKCLLNFDRFLWTNDGRRRPQTSS